MAAVDTANNPNDPNNPNVAGATAPAQNQAANQPATSGGAGAVSSTGSGNVTGQVVGTANAPQPFQNISAYLEANAPQSAALAGQVANSVSAPITQAQNDIGTSSQNFVNSVNAGYTPQDSNVVTSAASDPTKFASDPNNIAAFQKQLNDTYAGPLDFTALPDYSNLQTEVANAQARGTSAQTPTGIGTLLQDIEGPNYTAGINNLDTLLTTQDPNNVKTIRAAGDLANTTNNNLGNLLNTQTAQNTQTVKDAQAKAAAASGAARDAFLGPTGTLSNLNGAITSSTTAKTAQAKAQQDKLLADLKAIYSTPQDTAATTLGTYGGGSTPWYNTTNYTVGDLAPADLSALGIAPDQWAALQTAMQNAGTSVNETGNNFGAGSPTSQIDLTQFLTQLQPSTISNANVATPEQYAEASAIQQLLGTLPAGTAINPGDAALAGTAPASLTNFNYDTALKNSTEAYQQAIQEAKDEAAAISSAGDLAHAQSQHHGGFLGNIGNAIDKALLYNPVTGPFVWAGKQATGYSPTGAKG
jgi:hypothetical protein